MVDRKARRHALAILTKIKEQRLTNWQLEDEWPSSKTDPALNCILRWLWSLYDDFPEVPLIDILSKQDLQRVEKCCTFLSSEIEFVVSKLSFWEKIRRIMRWGREWQSDCTEPTDDYWPFPKNNSV